MFIEIVAFHALDRSQYLYNWLNMRCCIKGVSVFVTIRTTTYGSQIGI